MADQVEITRELIGDGDGRRLTAGRWSVRVLPGTTKVYRISEEDGWPMLVQELSTDPEAGIAQGVEYARQFLQGKLDAEQAWQDRQDANEKAVATFDQIKKDPERAVRAAREGARGPEPVEPERRDTHFSFDDMKKNPAEALARARKAQKENK